MSSTIAMGRETVVYWVPETTSGTLAEPVAGDLVLPINTPTATQDRETFDDAQIRNTRSRLTSIAGRYLAGTWNFDTYIKPSGTKGTAPQEDRLWTGLMGTKTTLDGTSVTYNLAGVTTDLSSYSMWMKYGHTVMMCTGATVNQAVVRVEGRNPGQISWSGGFMKRLWTGTSTLLSAIADATTTTVVSIRDATSLYNIGSIIKVDNEAMKVTAVDGTTATVTRKYQGTSAAAHSNGATVDPWWPTSGTEVGSPVHGRLGYVQLDSSNYNTLTNEVTITNGIKYYEEEKNGEDFASAYGTPEARAADARVTVYFRKEDTKRLKDAWSFRTIALTIPCGDTAGTIFELILGQAKITSPAITGDAERIQELAIQPFASGAYNDEVIARYR